MRDRAVIRHVLLDDFLAAVDILALTVGVLDVVQDGRGQNVRRRDLLLDDVLVDDRADEQPGHGLSEEQRAQHHQNDLGADRQRRPREGPRHSTPSHQARAPGAGPRGGHRADRPAGTCQSIRTQG